MGLAAKVVQQNTAQVAPPEQTTPPAPALVQAAIDGAQKFLKTGSNKPYAIPAGVNRTEFLTHLKANGMIAEGAQIPGHWPEGAVKSCVAANNVGGVTELRPTRAKDGFYLRTNCVVIVEVNGNDETAKGFVLTPAAFEWANNEDMTAFVRVVATDRARSGKSLEHADENGKFQG